MANIRMIGIDENQAAIIFSKDDVDFVGPVKEKKEMIDDVSMWMALAIFTLINDRDSDFAKVVKKRMDSFFSKNILTIKKKGIINPVGEGNDNIPS